MNPKAMRWVIYLAMAVAVMQMFGCDSREAERQAPVKPAVERPAQPTPAQRQAAQQQRDDLYRDWPQPKVRGQ